MAAASPRPLIAQPITPENFQLYGQVIVATEDGKPFDHQDAQLSLQAGTPRFYIMRLHHRGFTFSKITRHVRCTQCLGSLGNQPWCLAVAPPSLESFPTLDQLAAFVIPGNCFIKLEVGTWHAGPYFQHETVDFYNLELSDTNITDHETCNLQTLSGQEFQIIFNHDHRVI
jgi:ureidoglycolate hydrolase